MRKSKIIVLLLISLLFSSLPANMAMAAEENMVKNPSFSTDTSGWQSRYGAGVSWDANGYSGGAAKVKLVGGYSAIAQSMNFKPNRTYDISFYIRLEEGSSTVTVIQNFSGGAGGWNYLISSEPITTAWKKVLITYTCTGYNTKGGEVTGDGTLEFRIGDGQTKLVHYLDEVSVVQRPAEDEEEEPEITPSPSPTPTPLINRGVAEKRFADMENHWAKEMVTVLASERMLDGMDENTFMPEGQMTRAEFIKMIVSIFRLENTGYENIYADVKADAWYAEYMQTAYDIGLISPTMTIGGRLWPDKPITREEAASILYNAAEKKLIAPQKEAVGYKDSAEIALWAAEAVNGAAAMGLVNGYEDGTFRPRAGLTRAQGAVMYMNLLNKVNRIAIFVDGERGSDQNDGSFASPLASVSAAKSLAAKSNQSMRNNLYILIRTGEYYIDQTLEFTQADSGTNGYNIIYTSYDGGGAVLSGGVHINGFSLYDGSMNIYRAKVDKGMQTRQMFVNGVRAVRARSNTGLANCTTDNGEAGHTTTDTFLADYRHVEDLEMVYYEQWTNPRCGVSSITVEDGIATLIMDQPGWNAVRNKGGTSVTAPVYYENAIELLDEPGEWYLDTHEGYLYYIPRAFEDMQTADVVLPVTERLITLQGTADENIHNIYFDGLEFAYTTWMRPSTQNGHSDAQNNHLRQTGVPVMPDTAVRVENARYINFLDCKFDKLGITALQLFGGIKDCNVVGNEFWDISGSAVSLGQPDTGNANIWNPTEEKYMIRNNTIANNYIHSIAVDYKSAAAISAGFPKDTNIVHNEIFDAPYSGMHIGYGWDTKETTALENFRISENYIHAVMSDRIYDGGGIYLMGATAGTMENPNLVSRNYIESIRNYYGALYPDEGTQFWKITQNVIDLTDTPYWYGNGNNRGESKWLHCWAKTIRNMQYVDNYSTVANRTYNGTDSVFEEAKVYPDANWPAPAQAVMDEAGLEQAYLERFPVECQEVRIGQTEYTDLRTGDTFTIPLTGQGRKKQAARVDMEKVYFRSRDESVATVDKAGNVTAVGQGQTQIVVDILLGDILKTFEVKLTVDDVLDEIRLNTKKIQMQVGYDYEIKVKAYSKFGRKLDVEAFTLESADLAVAKPAGTKIVAEAAGETTVKVVVDYEGQRIEKEIPVTVLAAGAEAEDIGYDFTEELMSLEDWTMDNNVVKSKITNGMLVSTPSTFIAYEGSEFKDELFNFDIKINAQSGWPSICFRASDTTSPYSSASLYMLTFGQGSLELQRFNNGARTVIYGAQEGYESKGGPAAACSFTYGKKHTIQCGARNEDDGVRIVAYVDNVKVIDYLDTEEGAIREQGYVELYCRSGSMELSAPTK